MHSHSFQDTELNLHRYVNDSGTGHGGVDDLYAQRGIFTERFITYNPSISETMGIYI